MPLKRILNLEFFFFFHANTQTKSRSLSLLRLLLKNPLKNIHGYSKLSICLNTVDLRSIINPYFLNSSDFWEQQMQKISRCAGCISVAGLNASFTTLWFVKAPSLLSSTALVGHHCPTTSWRSSDESWVKAVQALSSWQDGLSWQAAVQRARPSVMAWCPRSAVFTHTVRIHVNTLTLQANRSHGNGLITKSTAASSESPRRCKRISDDCLHASAFWRSMITRLLASWVAENAAWRCWKVCLFFFFASREPFRERLSDSGACCVRTPPPNAQTRHDVSDTWVTFCLRDSTFLFYRLAHIWKLKREGA